MRLGLWLFRGKFEPDCDDRLAWEQPPERGLSDDL